MKTTTKVPDPRKTRALYKKRRPQYDAALGRMQRTIHSLLSKHSANFSIRDRVKSVESYLRKLQRLQSSGGPLVITDMLGLRLVCPFLEDVERVKGLIAEHFTVVEEESKGSDHSFREFGYDSIHLLVELPPNVSVDKMPHTTDVCEVQLRTTLQDAWAEVEHELIYKAEFSVLNEPVRRKLASLNATLTLSDIIFQEIRDYQKQMQLRGERRRASLQHRIQVLDKAVVLSDLDSVSSEKKYTESLPARPKSKLEGMVFDALGAHSDGRFAEAIDTYTRILAMKPPSHVRSIMYNHRGMAYFIQSKYKRAISDFTRALSSNRDNLGALNNRALTYRLLRHYEGALRDYSRSLDVDGYQMEVHYGRALTYYDLKDFAHSLEDCEKALTIDPEFSAAQSLRLIIHEKVFK